MKVKCPNCNASGSVRDDLVPEEGRSVRCPVCKEYFRVEKNIPEAEIIEEERRGPIYYPTYDPTYHLTDGGDPEHEEDLFLYLWFFGF